MAGFVIGLPAAPAIMMVVSPVAMRIPVIAAADRGVPISIDRRLDHIYRRRSSDVDRCWATYTGGGGATKTGNGSPMPTETCTRASAGRGRASVARPNKATMAKTDTSVFVYFILVVFQKWRSTEIDVTLV